MGMLIDVNGNKGPNRVGKDVKLSGGVAISGCDNPIGDMCWSVDFAANKALDTCDGQNEYDTEFTTEASTKCANNYWAGAKKKCEDMGMSLPTRVQLAQLASLLYGEEIGEKDCKTWESDHRVEEYKNFLTFGYPYWSNEPKTNIGVYHRDFWERYTWAGDGEFYTYKYYNDRRAICFGG